MSQASEFPILDFTKFHHDFQSFSQELYEASSRWGFFILANTGIEPNEIFDLSHAFFNRPMDEKAEKIMNEQAIGYDGKTRTTFAASEGMSFGTVPNGILETGHLPAWWDRSKRETIEGFKAQCYDLSINLLSCYAQQLGLGNEYFLKAHEHKDPGNTLKLIRYPPFESEENGAVPRLSEHTDWGSITFVFTKQGGLEIRDPSNNWFDVPVLDNCIVVNIGDAMSLWTNKALKSTMHRITWENLPRDKDRYSIAYFVNPNHDAVLNPPKKIDNNLGLDTDLTYRDYYHIRLRLTYGSLEETGTGKKVFADVDPMVLDVVKKLNIANSGILESHALKV